jgi:crotonobetainyl-CoA:carnitine CoA-transferase CaiB-like acyl-CoA transferase
VFLQGYRPGAIASHGFAPEELAALKPGIVCVSLSAYGHQGPWGGRRGFDSLVQTRAASTTPNAAAAGEDKPKAPALPGAGPCLGLPARVSAPWPRCAAGGGGRVLAVRVGLAPTAHWIRGLGRVEGGLAAHDPSQEDVAAFLDSGFAGW